MAGDAFDVERFQARLRDLSRQEEKFATECSTLIQDHCHAKTVQQAQRKAYKRKIHHDVATCPCVTCIQKTQELKHCTNDRPTSANRVQHLVDFQAELVAEVDKKRQAQQLLPKVRDAIEFLAKAKYREMEEYLKRDGAIWLQATLDREQKDTLPTNTAEIEFGILDTALFSHCAQVLGKDANPRCETPSRKMYKPIKNKDIVCYLGGADDVIDFLNEQEQIDFLAKTNSELDHFRHTHGFGSGRPSH